MIELGRARAARRARAKELKEKRAALEAAKLAASLPARTGNEGGEGAQLAGSGNSAHRQSDGVKKGGRTKGSSIRCPVNADRAG